MESKFLKTRILCLFSAFGVIYLIQKEGGIDDKRKYAMKTITCDPKADKSHLWQNLLENELNVSAALYYYHY